jgi:hypothetical protein
MIIEWVTGGGWWQIFRFRALAHPRARNSDNRAHPSQPVTCHPIGADMTFNAPATRARPGVENFLRTTL